jgi:hypothetical protein
MRLPNSFVPFKEFSFISNIWVNEGIAKFWKLFQIFSMNLGAELEHTLTVDGHNCQFKKQMDSAVEYECTSPNHGYDATAVKCGNSLQFKNLGHNVLKICEIEVYQNPGKS